MQICLSMPVDTPRAQSLSIEQRVALVFHIGWQLIDNRDVAQLAFLRRACRDVLLFPVANPQKTQPPQSKTISNLVAFALDSE
jgi:hypothetical protein